MTREPWPDGPLYAEWVGANRWRGWMLYKLKSADWYIDRLEDVGERLGFDRYVGVEMALDGALTALVGAFDAAVGAVIQAAELFEKQHATDCGMTPREPMPARRYDWKHARSRLLVEAAQVGVESAEFRRSVDLALDRDKRGWLVALRDLRNDAIHNDTLARHIDVHVGSGPQQTVWGISVNGQGEDPVQYLRTRRRLVELIVLPMLEACDRLAPHGIPTSRDIQNMSVQGVSAVLTISQTEMQTLLQSQGLVDGSASGI
jgi:hypothetical protein